MNRSLRVSVVSVAAAGAGLIALGVAAPAAAQTFPADDSPAWVAFECGEVPSFDPRGDDADFLTIEDVVGDAAAPAVFRAVDDEFLYLRLRIDEVADLTMVDAGWGFAFDLDDDLTDYEVLLTVDRLGDTPTVQLFRNPTTTIANSPADPAETLVTSYLFVDHTRGSAAASSIGGPDGFVAVAVPLADLAPLGIEPATELRLWAGSTALGNALDGDLACHDGSGGGAPPLSGSSSDRAPLDPDGGGDDDPGTDDPGTDDPGTDDGGDNGPRLEGGGGCAAATGATLGLPLVAALALRRRRRR